MRATHVLTRSAEMKIIHNSELKDHHSLVSVLLPFAIIVVLFILYGMFGLLSFMNDDVASSPN